MTGAYRLNFTLSDSQGTPPASAKLVLTIATVRRLLITTPSSGWHGRKAYPVTQLQASADSSLSLDRYLRLVTAGLRMSTTGAISGDDRPSHKIVEE